MRCKNCGNTAMFNVLVNAIATYDATNNTYSFFREIDTVKNTDKTITCSYCGHLGTYEEFVAEIEPDEELIKAFTEQWRRAKNIYYKVGNTFEAFGSKYRVCSGSDCDDCAFFDMICDTNPAIPSCNNNVHFEIVKEG